MKLMKQAGVLLSILALASAPASAQSPSAQDRATARLLAEEADKKLEAGDLKGAIELFQRADAIYPAPTLKLALARVLVKSGQIIEGHELLLDVMRSEPQKGEPSSWTSARDTARQEAEALAPRIPRIEILLVGVDVKTGAPTVTLDGRRIPNESLGVVRPINPGMHRVRADAEGFMPAEQKIQMGEGEHYKLTLKMFPEAAAAPTASAMTSAAPRPARSGAPARASAKPDDELSPRTLAIVGFSSAGVLAITGTVFGLVVRSKVNDIKQECTLPPGNVCPVRLRSEADQASGFATVSNVSFALAAVGLGVGFYGLLSGPSKPAAARGPAVRVGVGPGSVAVAGAF